MSLVPCPSWCTLPAGHGYDSLTRDRGVRVRTHGSARIAPDLHLDPEHNREVVGVDVMADETALSEDGAGAVLSTPMVSVAAEYPVLTAAEARTFADMLLAAADQAEEMNR